jgi:GAF domain-containing protein
MSTSAKQLTGETDRITRAIFEHASLISREQQLEELVRLNAEFARDLAQAQHCSLWLVDENKGQLWTRWCAAWRRSGSRWVKERWDGVWARTKCCW